MKKTMSWLVACMLCCSACATLPSHSDPEALRSFEGQKAANPQGPEENRAPDLLVRDFFAASADPTQNYQLARTYLTESAAAGWQPGDTITIVNQLDVNLAQDQTPSSESTGRTASNRQISYQVRGNVVGTVEVGGGYMPRVGSLESTISLEEVNGQWRISSLPDQIVIERTELRNRYNPHDVFFFDPSGSTLVADRRWVFSGSSSLDSTLISMIINGPSKVLAPGVMNELSSTATYAGIEQGVHQLTGVAGLSDDAQHRLLAQLVWALALADIPGPYRFAFDGVNATVGAQATTDLTVDDFAEFNPRAASSAIGTSYTLRDGHLSQLENTQLKQIDGGFGQLETLESVDIAAATNTIAAISSTGEGENKTSTLLLGSVDGQATDVLNAQTLTRPTFEYGATSVWTVLNGQTIARVARSAESGEIAQSEVDISDLGENHGPISVFRLSYSGVRAAFIIDGRVFVATVSRPNAGERKLTNVQEYLANFEGQALSLDWQADGSLLVGTISGDTPVWRVERDGSSAQALSSTNVSAPVVSVSSTPSTVYITDARAALELSNSGGGSAFWREVQGLEGVRSVVIIPR